MAICGAAGTLVAVVSGSAGLGTAHRVLAALALPPLAAVTAAAWINYRRLLPSALAALVLFGLAAAITAPALHLALSALAFAATLVLVAQSWSRGERTLHQTVTWDLRGSIRDYVALTKPRIMSLLLLTGLCGMIVGAGGLPPLWLVCVTMLGLGLAVLHNRRFRGRSLYRVLLIVPWAVPAFVSAFAWKFLFNPRFGLINSVLLDLGIDPVD